MSPPHSEPDDESGTGPRGGRLLLVFGVVSTVGATAVLVLSDDLRWLRLAVVAALWAALAGAFLTAKYRRQAQERQERAEELQEVYELELENEIAARQEHELRVEAETRRRIEDEARDDIAALRGELRTLRQTLESLLGGEVLVERYALHAESTRMRSVAEESRPLPRRQAPVKRLAAARSVEESGPLSGPVPAMVDAEAKTDLIQRVLDLHPEAEPQPAAQQPIPQSPPQPPPRRPARPTERPQPVPPAAASQRPQHGGQNGSARTSTFRPVGEPPPRAEPRPREPRGIDVSRINASPADLPKRERARPVPPPRRAEVSDRWFMPGGLTDDSLPPARQQQPSSQSGGYPAPWHTGGQAPVDRAEPAGRHASNGTEPQRAPESWLDQPTRRPYADSARYPVPTDSGYVEPVRQQGTGGRRHRAEADFEPSWSAGHEGYGGYESHGGGHSRYGDEPAPSGSHAAGRSVSELLAAHGNTANPRHRRRREP